MDDEGGGVPRLQVLSGRKLSAQELMLQLESEMFRFSGDGLACLGQMGTARMNDPPSRDGALKSQYSHRHWTLKTDPLLRTVAQGEKRREKVRGCCLFANRVIKFLGKIWGTCFASHFRPLFGHMFKHKIGHTFLSGVDPFCAQKLRE